ncbi:MAG: hypothetical protein AAFP97_09700 [Pseudomonadota bacterium]
MAQTVSILASDPAITDSLSAFLSAHGYDISLTPQQELSEAGQQGDIVILDLEGDPPASYRTLNSLMQTPSGRTIILLAANMSPLVESDSFGRQDVHVLAPPIDPMRILDLAEKASVKLPT